MKDSSSAAPRRACGSIRTAVRFLRIFALLFSSPFLVAAADGAEVAERHIHGFNSTGTVFVFEQFGTQDGSGFRYSDVFYILTADSSTAFLPLRTVVPETQTAGSARRTVRNSASGIAPVDGFLDMGRHVFHHALNETPPGVTSAQFHADFATLLGHVAPLYQVSIAQQVTTDPDCADLSAGNEKTFEVTLQNIDSGVTSTLWAAALPPAFYNYRCPTEYAIADVVTYQQDFGAAPKLAVLLSVLVVGFEGPDRRFVAVTGDLN
jgi:predicted secreted protein